jgi:hypothetical protein
MKKMIGELMEQKLPMKRKYLKTQKGKRLMH